MLMTLFVFLLVGGLVSSDDEEYVPGMCHHLIRRDGGNKDSGKIPDAEDIVKVCPNMKVYVICELEASRGKDDEAFEMFTKIDAFLKKICEEDSPLIKAYSDSVECYRRIDKYPECITNASEIFSKYRESSSAFDMASVLELVYPEYDVDDTEYFAYRERGCLEGAYQLACLGDLILDKCGSEAQDTYLTFATGSGYTNHLCKKREIEHFLTGFVNFLSDDEKKTEADIIRTLFYAKDD